MTTTKDTTEPVAPKATLFDMELARREVATWVQEESAANDGELPAWLDALQLEAEEALETKIERLRGYIHSQRRDVATIEAEMDRLQNRRLVRLNRVERLTTYVHAVMGNAGVKKVETALGTVSRVGHGGVRPFVFVAEPEVLKQHPLLAPFVTEVTPEPYLKVDKDGIRKALEAGEMDTVMVSNEAELDENGSPVQVCLVHLGKRGESVKFT